MPNEPTFVAEDVIEIGDQRIIIDVPGHYERFAQDDSVFFMAKAPGQVEAYVELAREFARKGWQVDGLLEIGTFRGGSAVFLDQLLSPSLLVTVDKSPLPVRLLENYRETHGHVHAYWGVEQVERDLLLDICRREFPDGLDLVVDDASHWYEETLATFEVAFPYVRPDGIYLIEAWAWAHSEPAQDPEHVWAGKKALTNLAFELAAAHGAAPAVFRRVELLSGYLLVERGWEELDRDGSFRLADWLAARGRELPSI